ncbi:MAG: type VI secretion system Vgr family protein [Succinivibrionaceae bacterium]
MASKYTPDSRNTTVTINGKGPFIVTKVSYTEHISQCSKMIVDFVTDKTFKSSDLAQVTQITHTIDTNSKINFYLLSSNISYVGYNVDKDLNQYKLVAEDPLSFLKFDKVHRVFQQKNTKAIIQEVFKNASLDKYIKFSTNGEGKTRDYCVQFNENSYDFVRRLCAEEGWHFHCSHKSTVELVVSDNNQVFEDLKNKDISYINPSTEITQIFTLWSNTLNIGTNNISLKDFSFVNAESFDNTSNSSIQQPITLSVSDYGYGAKDKGEITTLSKSILDGYDNQKEIYHAESEIKELNCGLKFNLKNHPDQSFNQEYIITGIQHTLICNESGENNGYKNIIECVPASITIKPQYLPKAQYTGTLTATVTGPSDKEIYTDDKGRIKVLPHFDAEAKPDENSSIWVPVAQTFAANGYGTFFLPRVGTTVIITFLNGDIDKPIVISSLYTDDKKIPFSKSSQLGIKTHSHPNGESNSGNELRFDDQKDAEEIYIHAQKDVNTLVENDANHTVKGNVLLTIEKKYTTSAKEEVAHSSEKSFSITSKENYNLTTEADSINTIKGNNQVIVTGNIDEKTDGNYGLNAKSNVNVDGDKITITGKSNITLKVGGSSIEITSSGITIKSTNITIKGTNTTIDSTKIDAKGSAAVNIKGANITVKADAKAEVSGLMTNVKASTMATVEGSAMLTLKGGLTRIN